MQPAHKFQNQAGFSLIEMMIAMVVMLIVAGAVVSLMKSSLSVSTASYEVTDAQESLRTAQEYINRDLMNAGDGLKSMTYFPVTSAFVTNYLTRTPVPDSAMPSGVTNLGIITSDNDVPPSYSVPAPSPAMSPAISSFVVRPNSDRQTIVQIDPDPLNVQIVPTSINSTGSVITLPAGTNMSKFAVGEIHFISSSKGGTFGAITAINTTAKTLTFSGGDYCGLNVVGSSGRIKDISAGGTIPTALQRMRIIHYFIDSNALLIRRVFGEKGVAFRDSVIAEHVVGVQFVYSLGLDSAGNPVQPTNLITNASQQVAISQVQVTVTVETPHKLEKSYQPLLSSTTSTSLRNMQFRQALQPKAPSPSPTP